MGEALKKKGPKKIRGEKKEGNPLESQQQRLYEEGWKGTFIP